MKKILIACLLLLNARCVSPANFDEPTRGPASVSTGERVNMYGTFASYHDVAVKAASSEQCQALAGQWQEGRCLFKSSNEIKITRRDGKPYVAISVIAPSAGHECEFEAFAEVTQPRQMIARRNDSVDDCSVTMQFASSNNVSVSAQDPCGCPEDAELKIPSAVRTRKFAR